MHNNPFAPLFDGFCTSNECIPKAHKAKPSKMKKFTIGEILDDACVTVEGLKSGKSIVLNGIDISSELLRILNNPLSNAGVSCTSISERRFLDEVCRCFPHFEGKQLSVTICSCGLNGNCWTDREEDDREDCLDRSGTERMTLKIPIDGKDIQFSFNKNDNQSDIMTFRIQLDFVVKMKKNGKLVVLDTFLPEDFRRFPAVDKDSEHISHNDEILRITSPCRARWRSATPEEIEEWENEDSRVPGLFLEVTDAVSDEWKLIKILNHEEMMSALDSAASLENLEEFS